jgi:hypothetical protein
MYLVMQALTRQKDKRNSRRITLVRQWWFRPGEMKQGWYALKGNQTDCMQVVCVGLVTEVGIA